MSLFHSLSILLACNSGETLNDTGTGGHGGDGGSSSIPCVETETPLSEATAPTTVEEVWPLIEAWDPTTITWQVSAAGLDGKAEAFETTFTQTSDTVVVTRTGGDVYSPTHPLACRPGPELRIPISADVLVDDGGATVHYFGSVDAQGASYSLTYFNLRTSADVPPVLSEDWSEAALTEIEGRGYDAEGQVIESSFSRGEFDGEWVPTWALTAVQTDGTSGAGLLWLGDLPAPE